MQRWLLLRARAGHWCAASQHRKRFTHGGHARPAFSTCAGDALPNHVLLLRSLCLRSLVGRGSGLPPLLAASLRWWPTLQLRKRRSALLAGLLQPGQREVKEADQTPVLPQMPAALWMLAASCRTPRHPAGGRARSLPTTLGQLPGSRRQVNVAAKAFRRILRSSWMRKKRFLGGSSLHCLWKPGGWLQGAETLLHLPVRCNA